MKAVPVRLLRNDTAGVIAQLAHGPLEITSRGRPVALLSPIESPRPRYIPLRELAALAAARATRPDADAYDRWIADLADVRAVNADEVLDPWERSAARDR